ncbi:hypothetical protein ACFQY4_23030 [Catellatospora bangladeshensis]|uniref:Uncharacterized protein n=1 Tax=Catellatospora bangladeshensis TaxID=310355 RepID=A0A8J3JH04_9ACTN|nr:hypothetical protein [Catellatospora bangladeshensis]GIF80332.1 hypothetical protein Cba03nite_16810 [Catellatospora bangladeshensis]
MEAAVLHQPRIAWDAARMLVTAAEAGGAHFEWFADELAAVLGSAWRQPLEQTRTQLAAAVRPDVRSVEAGKWRFRLEDALRTRPDVSAPMHSLVRSARVRFAHLG